MTTANPNPWNHPLCVYCGEPLTMNEFDFFCVYCGEPLTMNEFDFLCVYCGKPLTMNEYDFESDSWFFSHFRCLGETPNGRFEVVTYRDGVRMNVDSLASRHYTTAKRALSQAEYLAFSNPPSEEFIVYDHAPESSNESAPVAIAHFVGTYSPMGGETERKRNGWHA